MFLWRFFLCILLPAQLAAVSPHIMEKVRPYLLPDNHPAKKTLDSLFAKPPLADENSFREAGFQFLQRFKPDEQIRCARHPRLKGYLVKTYLDSQKRVGKEERCWISRIKGAELIRQAIAKKNMQKAFKVPRKWIYLLPGNPTIPHRRFILIVEDMHILDWDSNKRAYYFQMSRKKMDALYQLITENRLIDSIYIDNIPFCKDGRIAFIDTEHFHVADMPLRLARLTPYFCPPLAKYWEGLISNTITP